MRPALEGAQDTVQACTVVSLSSIYTYVKPGIRLRAAIYATCGQLWAVTNRPLQTISREFELTKTSQVARYPKNTARHHIILS